MIDIKLVRENPDIIRKDLEKRKSDFPLDELIETDKTWRKNLQKLEKMRAEVNKISVKLAKTKDKAKIAEMKKTKQEIKNVEKKNEELRKNLKELLMSCPNTLHESVPYGKDDRDNVEVRKWGEAKKLDYLKPHGELAEWHDIIDFKRATKVAGSGFFYLKGELALLDIALARFAIDHMMEKGYKLISPPLMMRKKAYEGVVDLSDFENVMYKIDGEDHYLIATSEHPIGAMYMDEILPVRALPIKFVGVSWNFRKEIGKHGVDTRGLFRTHQFNKVEQFIFCKPEDSWKLHEELIKNAEDLFKALEIPHRIVNVCTGDIGSIAAKKYDLEVWSPRQGKYIEIASCSNCTDYQARRSNIRYGSAGGKKEFLHTINSTAIATSRAMVAILENYQQEDGSILIPKVLQPYMNGIKKIKR